MTADYYQRDSLERSAVLKGEHLRCDGQIWIKGLKRYGKCGNIIAEIFSCGTPPRAIVQCKRCGKRYEI